MEWSHEMMWGKAEILMTLIREGPIEKVTFEERSEGGKGTDHAAI